MMAKNKTEDIDKQLTELQAEVRSQRKQTEEHKMIIINNHEKESGKESIKKFIETEEDTIKVLSKFNKLEFKTL